MNTHLLGFNFIEYLRRKTFIGQLHPALLSEDQRYPVIGLLVSIPTAIAECELWSGQELERHTFTRYLKDNNIFVGDADDFLKLKEQRTKNIVKENVLTKNRLYDIADAIDVSSLRSDGARLLGRKGHISANQDVVHVGNKSKRHYSSVSKQLAFMQPRSMYNEDVAKFALDRLPTPEEGELLRKVVGFKKRPTLSGRRKKQLQNQAKEKMAPSTSKMGGSNRDFSL